MTVSSFIRPAGSFTSRASGGFASRRKGFTLVEILIVVIILGILAAIVIPQFTNASTDAKKSNMASQAQTCKSQITLYSLQHNDTYPASGSLFTLLTEQTDDTGANPPGSGLTVFGPYLQATPTNPLTNSSSVDYVTTDPTVGTTTATGYGWVYNATDGSFHGVNLSGIVSDDGN
jgi:general secretion pathway protein G